MFTAIVPTHATPNATTTKFLVDILPKHCSYKSEVSGLAVWQNTGTVNNNQNKLQHRPTTNP